MAGQAEAPSRPDGRQLRSSRTREAVARAMLVLLEGGNLQPTARDVATQAGVSERAVFRHFEDLEGLLHAVSDIHAAKVTARAPAPATADAPLAARVASFVTRWCEVYEMITPVRRAANLKMPFSDEIRSRHAWMRTLRARELRDALGLSEREAASAARRDLVAAIGGLVSWSYWEQLRAHQRLPKARALATVRMAVDSLVASTNIA